MLMTAMKFFMKIYLIIAFSTTLLHNIKFPVEKRDNNNLSFLDTHIRLIVDRFEFCVFRKSANADVLPVVMLGE